MFRRFGVLAVALCGAMSFAGTSGAQTTPQTTPQISVKKPLAVAGASVQKTLKTCFQCHGPKGISKLPSRPTIAGQKGNYIAQQLTAFLKAAKSSDSVRSSPVMEHVVQGLDAAMIVKVASVVSTLACRKDDAKVKMPPPTPPAVAGPCATCHGVDGIGIQINTPNLAGQQRTYLRRELLLIRETAWGAIPRDGEIARAHPIMESQVARLKIQDVDALAQYYSTLDCRGSSTP
ncbi:MAG: hypothetical protein COB46_09870 [Rhodospirillaceae bacterium]|nr:MAG: hypothetical protein COB46_09870 [Rhodospirillaceae bacterium]